MNVHFHQIKYKFWLFRSTKNFLKKRKFNELIIFYVNYKGALSRNGINYVLIIVTEFKKWTELKLLAHDL